MENYLKIKKRKKEFWSKPSTTFGDLKVTYYIQSNKNLKK